MQTNELSVAAKPRLAAAPKQRRILDWLTSARGGLMLSLFALALTLPALGLGLMTDDRAFAEKFRRGDGPLVVYSITQQEIAAGKERGMYPWWTSPELRLHFLRPLSALSHELDYRAFAGAPWVMHLVNGVLYALVVLIAFHLYRAVLPQQPLVAALASLMFAIDDGHATTAGWIASRSMLLASVFGLGAMWLYVRARVLSTTGSRSLLHRAGATLMFALALCAAESGLSTLAYLAAYALSFETGSLPKRIARLAPELAVFAVWTAVYVAGGYGVRGLSLYRELSSPLSVLGGGLSDLPAWLFILLGPSLVDMAMLQAPGIARSAAAVMCLPLLLALYYALPRTRASWFFGLGALFCLPPLFTTLPQDRLLTMASFGGFGIVASLISAIAQRAQAARWLRITRGALITLHLVLAPLLFIPALGQNRVIDQAALTVASALPQDPPRHVVLVNTPVELLTLYAWQRLSNDPESKPPETLAQLYAGGSQVTVRRVNERTLELRPEHGWGNVPIERVFANVMPQTGAQLRLTGMEISVEEGTSDGRPARVQFRFPTALEDPSLLFLAWHEARPVPWQPPEIGREQTLEALSVRNLIQP
jgi:hypothetical protein